MHAASTDIIAVDDLTDGDKFRNLVGPADCRRRRHADELL